jgi:hypothetical protein
MMKIKLLTRCTVAKFKQCEEMRRHKHPIAWCQRPPLIPNHRVPSSHPAKEIAMGLLCVFERPHFAPQKFDVDWDASVTIDHCQCRVIQLINVIFFGCYNLSVCETKAFLKCSGLFMFCASHMSHYISHITHHTSHITHHTSHITHHTSHITHHTSHITHHTSHITQHKSPFPHGAIQ